MHTPAQSPVLSIRPATPDDIPQLLAWIHELAVHEERPEAVSATEESLRHWIFEKNAVRTVMADANGLPAGYAMFYPTFSSFAGKGNLYLEDLFVLPALRGQGYGRAMMQQVAALALREGYHSLHWSCLSSNKSSLRFYQSLGAAEKPDGRSFYLDEGQMAAFAAVHA